MSFKEQLTKLLEDKLQSGNTSLLESVDEFAQESGLTESQHTQVLNALAKYVDGATAKIAAELVEHAAATTDEYATKLQESFDEKEAAITEAAEAHADYLKTGAEEYAVYLKEHYEAQTEAYIEQEVKPELMESIDSYMAIMAAKLDEQGRSGVNVLKAARYDQLSESLKGLGFVSQINESEEDLSEIERLSNELNEAQETIKQIGKQLKESQTAYRKARTKDVVDELTEGLSDVQKDRVGKLAAHLDESAEDFEDLVKDLVESVKTRTLNKTQVHNLEESQEEKPANDRIAMYANFAKSNKTRLA